MEIFVCKKIGCTKLGNIYSNKYALEKHFRSHSDENNLILLGKRKRDVFETPPPPEPNFNCVCVCVELIIGTGPAMTGILKSARWLFPPRTSWRPSTTEN